MKNKQDCKEHKRNRNDEYNDRCNLAQMCLIQQNIIRRHTDQHDPEHRIRIIIRINDRNRHLYIVILHIIMRNILATEAPYHFLRNNDLVIIQIVGIMINRKILIHDNNTTVINGRKHINLCLNRTAFCRIIHRHIFTCRNLICQNLGLT